MKEWIVSVSGIRGIVGECFPPHDITRMAAAFGTLAQRQSPDQAKILIAADPRTSGPMARHAVVAGLLATGCHVIDLGICPTPSLLLASKELQADGSFMITASHNPAEWNGLEIAARQGTFLTSEDRDQMLHIYESETMDYRPWDAQGRFEERDDAISRHIDRIMASSYVDPELIRKQSLKVVVDAVNGAGCAITPRLLRELGCEVIEIHGTPNGVFEREPEPTPKHLDTLCDAVQQYQADLGLAHDADADRVTLVTEQGEAISEEYTLALIADLVLSHQVGAVVTTVSTSLMVNDVAQKYGAPVMRTKVGVNHVVDEMFESDSVIGGEGTGGIIFPEVHHTSDGITAAGAMLQLLAESRQPLSQRVADIPQYFIAKKSLPIPASADPDAVVQRAIEAFHAEQLDLTDGVKILRGNSWVSIRKSGTEPVIRVFGEARSAKQAEDFCGEIAQQLEQWMQAE